MKRLKFKTTQNTNLQNQRLYLNNFNFSNSFRELAMSHKYLHALNDSQLR